MCTLAWVKLQALHFSNACQSKRQGRTMLPEPEVAIAALGHIKAIGKRSILEKILMVA